MFYGEEVRHPGRTHADFYEAFCINNLFVSVKALSSNEFIIKEFFYKIN